MDSIGSGSTTFVQFNEDQNLPESESWEYKIR